MISVKNLSYGYSKKEFLFKDLDFNKKEGNIIGLLGKNGAGKSTFLKLLSGLLFPSSGEININGYEPLKRNPDFLSEIFLIGDTPFYPNLSIKKYTKVLAPFYKNFDVVKMHKILTAFEINDSYILNEISHGQQKKFTIAFALATNSKLLLLDEPTNGLDIPSKSIFRQVLVNSINEEQTVLISTHQVKDIENIIDEIVIIEKGKILFQKDIFSITEKLAFQKLSSISNIDKVLYSEKCPEGYNAILTTSSMNETELDIELLFNAITKNIDFKI